jgi:agmatine/peptidylarginine deiminase
MRLLRVVSLFALMMCLSPGASAANVSGGDDAIANLEDGLPVLPRVREGGTPFNERQLLTPVSIDLTELRDGAPTSGLIASPPEYGPTRGVLFFYTSSQWPAVVRDLVVALTADPAHDEIAYVVCTSTSQASQASTVFSAAGADMSKVEFIIEPGNALWIRDYGPHFIWQNGTLGIVDSHYYPQRPQDNFIPTLIGDDHLMMPTYDMGLYYSGGNFQPGPNRTGFVTALIQLDNPASAGFSTALIGDLYKRFQGIDTLHIMPQLPFSVDGTGHIDMWFYMVDEDTVIISQFKAGSDATAISVTNNAVPYMQALGFEVFRPQAWNVSDTHYTYTNAFRVNDRIFIPTYGQGSSSYLDEDADALAKWQAAAGPDVEIVPIDCYDIIPAAGAIHCIVMQVPRYTAAIPAAHVISPAGGDLLLAGSTHTIEWNATDTDNAVIPTIDLYYSVDGGAYQHIATTTDSGFYDWTVPDVSSDNVRVKVVATSADSDQGEGISMQPFQIKGGTRSVYTFETGAGVDHFAWGYQTGSWASVNGQRKPVTSEVDTLVTTAYSRMATSDATGTASDTRRYVSPTVGSGSECTHIFEFAIDEDPELIDDLKVHWEGFAANCTQNELYIWDYVQGNWGDADGNFGQNFFVDSWAGNRDGYLDQSIREDIGRYINDDGVLTLMLYAERSADETYSDYVSVTVTSISEAACPNADVNQDGISDGFDIAIVRNTANWLQDVEDADDPRSDVNGDGVVDGFDIAAIRNTVCWLQ